MRARKIKDRGTPEGTTLVGSVAAELGVTEKLAAWESGEFDPAEITHVERRLFLLLMDGGPDVNRSALARKFGVSRRAIERDLQAIRKQIGERVSLEILVGQLVLAGESLSRRAAEMGDVATAWKILRERCDVLIRMGYAAPTGENDARLTRRRLEDGYERAVAVLAKVTDPSFKVLAGEVVQDDA